MTRRIVRLATWTVLTVVLGLLVALVAVPRVTGAVALSVLSGSMEPAIPAGAMIVVRDVDPAQLRVGDVITYQLRSGEPVYVTHRIVGVGAGNQRQFTTRGDANEVADPDPVRAEQVQGRLWYQVPLVGHLGSLLTGRQRAIGVGVIGAVLLATSVYLLATGLGERLRSHRGDAPEAGPDPDLASSSTTGSRSSADGDRR